MGNTQPKLTVIAGGMFAGKTSALIAQGKRHMIAGRNTLFIKPVSDTRYDNDSIVTHDGQKIDAINVSEDDFFSLVESAMIDVAEVILLDEVQFFDGTVAAFVDVLLEKGKIVICAGLDMDYTGHSFIATAHLLARADEIIKLKAVCACCGADSTFTHKADGSGEVIELGASEKYVPLCRNCYYHEVSVIYNYENNRGKL